MLNTKTCESSLDTAAGVLLLLLNLFAVLIMLILLYRNWALGFALHLLPPLFDFEVHLHGLEEYFCQLEPGLRTTL